MHRSRGHVAVAVIVAFGILAGAPVSALASTVPVEGGTITVTSGSGQQAALGRSFASPLEVVVTNPDSSPMPGVVVMFTAPPHGPSGTFPGRIKAQPVITKEDGIAISPPFKANTSIGTYVVRATVSGIDAPAEFSLTNAQIADVSVKQSLRAKHGAHPSVIATLTVKNRGPNAAAGLLLDDLINSPEFTVSVVSSDPPADSCFGFPPPDGDDGALACTLPTLARGASWIVKLEFASAPGGTLTSLAVVITNDSTDPNGAGNVSTKSITYP